MVASSCCLMKHQHYSERLAQAQQLARLRGPYVPTRLIPIYHATEQPEAFSHLLWSVVAVEWRSGSSSWPVTIFCSSPHGFKNLEFHQIMKIFWQRGQFEKFVDFEFCGMDALGHLTHRTRNELALPTFPRHVYVTPGSSQVPGRSRGKIAD